MASWGSYVFELCRINANQGLTAEIDWNYTSWSRRCRKILIGLVVRGAKTVVVRGKNRILSWARLLQKVYEVDPFVCPKCQGTMSVVAIIEDPKELAKIINWAKQQEREQPVAVCARSPPELALV